MVVSYIIFISTSGLFLFFIIANLDNVLNATNIKKTDQHGSYYDNV